MKDYPVKVVFQNHHYVERTIAHTIKSKAFDVVKKFCKDHNYSMPYVRSWKDDEGRIVLDVGSHDEFFFIVKEGEN